MWNGELIRESTKQGNATVARQIEAARRTSLAKGEVGIRERKLAPTLESFCKERLEPWAKATFEKTVPKSWDWYRTNIGIICNSSLSNLRLDRITNEHVANLASKMLARYAVASVNSTIRVLRRALRLASEWGMLDQVPKLKKLSGENHREHVVTRDEEKTYLAFAEQDLADFMTLEFDTGLRPDEAYSLRWESVNWGGRNGSVFVAGGKTAAARRTVPMAPRLKFVLENRWDRAGKPVEGWVFPAETKSGHADHCTFKRRHKNALRKSKVRPFVVYSARHTFLTRLGESGCDAWTLARIAGHSNISISMRYVHPSQDAVTKAFENLGGHNSGHSDHYEGNGAHPKDSETLENSEENGEPGRTRTCDPLLRRQLL